MSSLSYCFWCFLLGALLGWLASWLICKKGCSKSKPAKITDAPLAEKMAATIPTKTAKPKKATAIDLKAARAAGIKIKSANDLTIIEGIGPKINDLFKNAGLKTFAQVSEASVAQMRSILDRGGARFRIANPSSWAKQAKLASNNKWAALKKLQDELSGGIKK